MHRLVGGGILRGAGKRNQQPLQSVLVVEGQPCVAERGVGQFAGRVVVQGLQLLAAA